MLKSNLLRIAATLDEEIDSGVREAAEEIMRGAKARVPRDTGALRDAITVDRLDVAEYRVVAGNEDAWYGHIVEGGSAMHTISPSGGALRIGDSFVRGEVSLPAQPPRPFLIPAYEAVRAHIDDNIRVALKGLKGLTFVTSAAILDIVLRADTSAATTALRRYQTNLGKVDKTVTTSTRTTSRLGDATKATGSRLASAARFAAGAAAAYLSISQAKAAVETTQQLAGASATLSRNLGLTTKQASRWASVARTRDVDTKTLNASFTTLASNLADVRNGVDDAIDPFKALGVTQKDLQKDGNNFNKTLFTISDALDDAKGGAERQAAAADLLGRGYQNLVPIMGQGSDALREQLKLGDQYGATMGGKAVKAQTDLTAKLRESERAWQGLQVTFTQMITPAISDANDVFQQLSRIMASDKLTNAEKFEKVGNIIGKWADKALDAFVGILPDLVERAAEAAPKIAGALAKGIMNAPIWGTLLLGGWLLKGAALSALGSAVGGKIAGGVGLGLKAGVAGVGIGGALAAVFTSGGIADTIEGKGATWGTKFGDAFAATAEPKIQKAITGFDVDTLQALHKPLKDLQRWFEETGAGGSEALDGLIAHANRARKRIAEDVIRIGDEIQAFGHTWGQTLNEINHRTDKNMADIERSLGLHSRRGRQAVSDNFFAAQQAIENSMKSGEISAKQGAKAIHEVLVKQLKSYGIKDVAGFLNRQEQASQAHQGGGVSGLASGGLAAMVPGRSTGDKHTLSIDGVPKARVESGEGVFVGNRKMMGAAAVANAAVPRFAKGGAVPPGMEGSQPGIISLMRDVIGQFGGAASGIRPGDDGFHGQGMAADWVGGDWVGAAKYANQIGPQLLEGIYTGAHGGPQVSWDSGSQVPSSFWGSDWAPHATHIHFAIGKAIAGAVGAVMDAIKLPRFSSDFGLGSLVATGLNNMAAGVETVANKHLPVGDTAITGTSYSGPLDRTFGDTTVLSSAQMKTVMGSAGLPSIFSQIAFEESGNRPGIVSSDGGYGLWQITKGASGMDGVVAGMGGYPEMLNPIKNAAIAKMMFDDRNTQPWFPSGPWPAVQRGGLLKLAEGGSIPELFPQLGSADQDTRKDTQARILEKIGKFGMHPDTLTRLFQGTKALAEHQEYAGLAASGDITDANDNLIPGLFRSGTEHSWLLKARDEAWTLRENLIKADTAMRPQIEAFESKDGLIKKAEKRLKQVRDALHDAQVKLKDLLEEIERQRDIIEDAKEKLEKKGLSDSQKKHQQDRIDTAQKVIENITGERVPAVENAIDRATRERDALVEPVIPALAAKFEELRAIKDGIRGDSYSDELTGMGFDGLKTIQGTGSSMDLFPMPDDLHQRFGGTLNDIQQQLLAMIPEAKPGDTVIDQLEAALALSGLTADLSDDIAAQSQIVTYWEEELARLQSSGGSAQDIGSAANSLQSARDALAGLQETTGGSDTDSLKLEALMAENARLRMSAQQAGTFAGFFKQFSAMPQFATGGVMSQTGPALVHGREGIFTPEQMAALGGRGDVNVNVNLDGMDVVVETWIDGVLAKETRKALSRGPTVGRRTS